MKEERRRKPLARSVGEGFNRFPSHSQRLRTHRFRPRFWFFYYYLFFLFPCVCVIFLPSNLRTDWRTIRYDIPSFFHSFIHEFDDSSADSWPNKETFVFWENNFYFLRCRVPLPAMTTPTTTTPTTIDTGPLIRRRRRRLMQEQEQQRRLLYILMPTTHDLLALFFSIALLPIHFIRTQSTIWLKLVALTLYLLFVFYF
jgi:hypothetical protein